MPITKKPLFFARTDGYKTCRVPSLLVTPGNAVLVTTEARPSRGGDWDPNDILMRRSTDGGENFSDSIRLAAAEEYGPGPCSNFSPIADGREDLTHALFCHNYERVFYMRSSDDGEKFTEPREITGICEEFREEYAWTVIATNPGHCVQTTTGRLVVPVWMSTGEGTEFGAGRRGHRPSAVGVIYSDDHGESWECGEIVCRNGDSAANGREIRNPSETSIAVLSDGGVVLNIRNESYAHRRLLSYSSDGVSDWSQLLFKDELLEPICLGSMLSLQPADDGLSPLLFANPANVTRRNLPPINRVGPEKKGKPFDRINLTLRLSADDGKTWPVSRQLQHGPSGYSDLVQFPDGTVLCVYECGVVSGQYDDLCIMLARIDPVDLFAE